MICDGGNSRKRALGRYRPLRLQNDRISKHEKAGCLTNTKAEVAKSAITVTADINSRAWTEAKIPRSVVFVRLSLTVIWLGVRVTGVLRIGFISRCVGLRGPSPRKRNLVLYIVYYEAWNSNEDEDSELICAQGLEGRVD
jgi:hypothetical protein